MQFLTVLSTESEIFDLATLLGTSVTSVQTQLFTVLNIVVPSIVGILAAVVAVKFGIKWMKRLGQA